MHHHQRNAEINHHNARFLYNGVLVRPLGPVQTVPGGYVRRVEMVDPAPGVVDVRFDAVVSSNGLPKR